MWRVFFCVLGRDLRLALVDLGLPGFGLAVRRL